jgi:tRNA 2-thiouridine synthesizing protein A
MSERGDRTNDLHLDLRGLACPLPVLRTRKALLGLSGGRRLIVEATDPLAAIDIPHFVRESGNRLVSAETVDGVYRCVIERA